MKLDALYIAFSQASYRNVKSCFVAYLLYSIACCLPPLRNSVYDDSSFF